MIGPLLRWMPSDRVRGIRNRLLLSILAVVVLTTAILGVPLTFTAWRWVEETTRNDLRARLDRIASDIIAQEGAGGVVTGELDVHGVHPLIPEGGRLVIVYPAQSDSAARRDIGVAVVPEPIVESLAMGQSGSLRLEVPSAPMRAEQRQAIGVVALVVLMSLGAGTAVAVVTARRLAGPLRDVAARAARLTSGDFRLEPRRHHIPELDRVSDVLDSAAVEIAGRLQREHALVADVSHQLRSRLTAVRLRLDELSEHSDPAVVDEAEAALAQVDRLTEAIDELLRASREDSEHKVLVPVHDELAGLMTEWQGPFRDAGRELRLLGDPALRAAVTGSRLREAVSVLVDNALMHGGGRCTVLVRLARGAGNRVCVEVADEGAGVSDELAPHIFGRGFSGAGSTGVGLALARALVEADGGRLELQRRKPALFVLFLGTPEPDSATAGVPEPR